MGLLPSTVISDKTGFLLAQERSKSRNREKREKQVFTGTTGELQRSANTSDADKVAEDFYLV